MYIVWKNAKGCELDRKQVFHDQTTWQALRDFIEDKDIELGEKFEIVDNED